MTPPKPNRTASMKPNDRVMTRPETARWIVEYFSPSRVCLDPCAGENAFYNALPTGSRGRCEITDGIDFFQWTAPADWIISNPPYSIYDAFHMHAMTLADHVVWLVHMQKLYKSQRLEDAIYEFGGLREIVKMGSGTQHGFPFGFQVLVLHYQRGYHGGVIKETRAHTPALRQALLEGIRS